MENIKQNQDRCPICGSPHFIKIDSNEYQCENCGFLKVHNEELSEEKILVINAYSILRQGNYVDAEEAFDDILNKYKNNYEALWGKICSHHGIVFVEDNNKIYPAFHDIVDINFLEEKDYKRFLSICPEKLKEVYINLAKRIEDLRDKYYKQVLKEKPYDIFISFKASDEKNNKTKDYFEATNLHSFLVEKGYKVFFSPVSLKEKTASEYEPYIYHALRTAKVMIVYGQKEEYFEAKWLKNEWGRFIRMIDEGIKEDGSLIVCYENMNPNNLPNRLKKLQCLNLSDKTAYITLDKVLHKLINEKINSKQKVNDNNITMDNVIIGNIIEFGSYPETLKDKSINIISNITDEKGFYLGDDNEKYAYLVSNIYENETTIKGIKIKSGKGLYFKVEPIKWKVKNVINGKACLESENIIDSHLFDDISNNYETSCIRKYLNNDFYNRAFTENEKKIITETDSNIKVVNTVKKGIIFKRKTIETNEKMVRDKVTLIGEELNYEPKKITDYAKANYGIFYTKGRGKYWIKKPNESGTFFNCSIDWRGDTLDMTGCEQKEIGVVPVIWIDLK